MNAGIGALGPVQPRQFDDRPRLQLAVSEPAKAAHVPGETYMGSLGNFLDLQRLLRRKRKSAARGRRSMSITVSSRTDSTVSVFFGGWYTQSGYGPRDNWQSRRFIRCLAALEHCPHTIDRDGPDRGARLPGSRLSTNRKLSHWCAENAS